MNRSPNNETGAVRYVLRTWFSDSARQHWFRPSAEFDELIGRRLGTLARFAMTGALQAWEPEPEGALALCILLDQVPRNIFRGTPAAFAGDDMGVRTALKSIDQGFDRLFEAEKRQFFYLPLMHSEKLDHQLRSVELYEKSELLGALRYASEHADIIKKFGRFPHRNAILGRASTDQEAVFLGKGSRDFGQTIGEAGIAGVKAC